jgi:lipocalin-like protein
MAFDPSTVPDVLFGTWKQLSGTYVDLATGEERAGLSKAPNGYIHFARDGRMFNITVDSARQKPTGPRPTAAEAEALFRTLIAYTGTFLVDGDQVYFDLDVSWNESWTGTRQVRTFELAGDRLMISAQIINPMTGRPARHRLTFEKVAS